MAEVSLPNNWIPRHYQLPVFDAFRRGIRRAVLTWARRTGKDDFSLHYTATQAMQRVGNYWHMLPQANQCRKAIWDAVNPRTGKRRIDEAFPDEIRAGYREQDMLLKFANGSTWQLVGSDSFDSLLGSPPVGLTFSEYATADPRSWAMLRPIVTENNGWAMFISTPRGKNHFYKLFEMAKTDPLWYTSLVTALESGVYTEEMLEQELRELVSEYGPEEGKALYEQEYFCSFTSPIFGAYYAAILDQIDAAGQITSVPYDPLLPVTTAWDLGVGDSTAIWFLQHYGLEIRVIDYLEASGEGLGYYARELNRRPYVYAGHIMPHDVRVRELGTGKSRYETALSLGVRPITIARRLSVDDGIQAVRSTLPRMWFDKTRCALGLDALYAYHKEYDDKLKDFKNKPYHDAASHGSDAMRSYCVGYQTPVKHRTVTELMSEKVYSGVW